MSSKIFFFFFALVVVTFVWVAHDYYPNFTRDANLTPAGYPCFQTNGARLSNSWDENDTYENDEGKFHLVTTFVLHSLKTYNWKLVVEEADVADLSLADMAELKKVHARPPTKEEMGKRQQEIERTLQNNLNHEVIARVHILYHHPLVHVHLMTLKLQNSSKLVLHLTGRNPSIKESLEYVQHNLMNKTVILAHMDNTLGEGWNVIDLEKLRVHHIMYALTRWKGKQCKPSLFSTCNPGAEYIGSHDTFVFFMDKPFGETVLKGMDMIPTELGVENLLIWLFEKELKFKILNPCRIIRVYHDHCVPIRNKNRVRYNGNGKSGVAGFTDKLF